jgi:hypothetical protein
MICGYNGTVSGLDPRSSCAKSFCQDTEIPWSFDLERIGKLFMDCMSTRHEGKLSIQIYGKLVACDYLSSI